ncbi:hypothetical protein FACS1894109_11270 [Spirochaetia bacterium]|nr:hypothetical protein FACS1894109_11270 [Spirochaetia bacterium]
MSQHPLRTSLIILLPIIIGLFIVHIIFFNDTLIENFVAGLLTEIIGIVITLIFVQRLFDRNDERKSRIAEQQKILRADRVVQLLMIQYINFMFHMTTSYHDLDKENPSLEHNFTFLDFKNVYNRCLLLSQNTKRSSVSLFLQTEVELRNLFVSLLQNIDFYFSTELSDMLLDFINTSFSLETREGILANEKNELGKMITEGLEKSGNDYLKSIREGKPWPSNAMYPYAQLFLMVTKEKEILLKYQSTIDIIRQSNSQKRKLAGIRKKRCMAEVKK